MAQTMRALTAGGLLVGAILLASLTAFAQNGREPPRSPTGGGEPATTLPAERTPPAGNAAPAPTAGGAALDPRAALQKAMTPSSDGEIRFGMTGPFSGASKEFGRQLAIGIETAFKAANETGGVGGRQLKLITGDDGYEPGRTLELVRKLVEQDKVSGFVGSFGTANAEAVLPWLQEHNILFYAPFTGAAIVRANPPDQLVFNLRPSYAEETEAAVRYLVGVRGIRPRDIAVFAQDDGFGQAGYDGAAKALRALSGGRFEQPPIHLVYKRNSLDVAAAVATVQRSKFPPKAFVLVALYRPAAKFIEAVKNLLPGTLFTNVSAVGSSALAQELAAAGARYADGIVVTQSVPAVNGFSKIVSDFKAALARHYPGEQPDYLSLEGYVEAKLLVEAVRRAGAGPLDGPKLATAFEGMGGYDAGLGVPLAYSAADHNALHSVWGTALDGAGKYRAIDLK